MTIELATSLVFLINSIYGPATTTNSVKENIKTVDQPKQEVVIVGPESLEDHVREYFKDSPILAEIAGCESQYRQFRKDGGVIRGIANSDDVGLMQINEQYQAARAKKLGFDIYTVDGNMAYAKWLYEKEGVKPWMSSSKCWNTVSNEVALNSAKSLDKN